MVIGFRMSQDPVKKLAVSLSEGAGVHTKKFKRCVASVASKQEGSKKAARNAAYSICMSTFQDAGYFEPGTADLTAKGRNALGVEEAKKPPKPGKVSTAQTKFKNGVMGLSGGGLAAIRAAREIAPTLKDTVLATELTTAAFELESLIAKLKNFVSRVG
jgi:hypothetical protein